MHLLKKQNWISKKVFRKNNLLRSQVLSLNIFTQGVFWSAVVYGREFKITSSGKNKNTYIFIPRSWRLDEIIRNRNIFYRAHWISLRAACLYTIPLLRYPKKTTSKNNYLWNNSVEIRRHIFVSKIPAYNFAQNFQFCFSCIFWRTFFMQIWNKILVT